MTEHHTHEVTIAIVVTKEGVISTEIEDIVQGQGIDMSVDVRGVAQGKERELHIKSGSGNGSGEKTEEMAMVMTEMVQDEGIEAPPGTGFTREEVITLVAAQYGHI